VIASLRAFALYLLSRQWQRRHIAQQLRHFRSAAPVRPPMLSASEVRRLLKSVARQARNAQRDYAVVQLMLQCGLRVGEVAQLVFGDLTLNRTNGRLRVRDRKGRSERVLALNVSVRRALRRQGSRLA